MSIAQMNNEQAMRLAIAEILKICLLKRPSRWTPFTNLQKVD
jgi:hypothetical protein